MSWGERVEGWVEARRLPIALALAGLILTGAGVVWWRMPADGGEAVEVLSAATSASQSGQIVVDVAGAVVRPGVYEIGRGDRVSDVLERAGGLASEADEEWVAKYLNRADKVKDGQKIYVPGVKELESGRVEVGDEKMNINTASQSELESLPGVGPVTAGKMIAGRPYGRTEELIEKKIVGQKVWDQIKDMVAVW